jgi:hypothetical protein
VDEQHRGPQIIKTTTKERPKKMIDLIWNILTTATIIDFNLTTGSTISTIYNVSPALSAVLSY